MNRLPPAAVIRATGVVLASLSDADLDMVAFHALIDSRLLEVPARLQPLVSSLYTEWDGQRLHTETRAAILALNEMRVGGSR